MDCLAQNKIDKEQRHKGRDKDQIGNDGRVLGRLQGIVPDQEGESHLKDAHIECACNATGNSVRIYKPALTAQRYRKHTVNQDAECTYQEVVHQFLRGFSLVLEIQYPIQRPDDRGADGDDDAHGIVNLHICQSSFAGNQDHAKEAEGKSQEIQFAKPFLKEDHAEYGQHDSPSVVQHLGLLCGQAIVGIKEH